MLVDFLDGEGFRNLGACSPFFAKRGHGGPLEGSGESYSGDSAGGIWLEPRKLSANTEL